MTNSGCSAIIFSATSWWPVLTIGTDFRDSSVLAMSRPIKISLKPIESMISAEPFARAITFEYRGVSSDKELTDVTIADVISIAFVVVSEHDVRVASSAISAPTTRILTSGILADSCRHFGASCRRRPSLEKHKLLPCEAGSYQHFCCCWL